MDVLMLTKWDWANTAYRFAKSLRLLDLSVESYKGLPLGFFNYPEQDPLKKELIASKQMYPIIVEAPQLRDLVEQAKVVYFMHTTFVDTGANLIDKNVVVQHGGITYRLYPEKSNQLFNPIVNNTIIQCPDLLDLGAKNEVLIYYPVDTDLLQPDFTQKGGNKVLIGHFPSNPKNKGTKSILKIVDKLMKIPTLAKKFSYIGTREIKKGKGGIDWLEHLDRVRSCDVLIETHKLELGGKKFGEWGNQAIEGAALGKVVVTNSLSTGLYAKEYGDCALHVANTAEELEGRLIALITMDRDKLLEEKHKSREWVVKKHSLLATAERLKNKIFHKLFDL